MNDPIVPDDKDWTWVLERPCPDCGFDARAIDVTSDAASDVDGVGTLIRANAAAWVEVLCGDDGAVRRRPTPDCWSSLEYGAHVRDVFVLFRERLTSMLCSDDPLFANWDQDATAVASRYDLQDPSDVAVELQVAADELGAAFDGVEGEQWRRPGRRSDGAVFTVESFARYLLHDPIHHLWDVTHGDLQSGG